MKNRSKTEEFILKYIDKIAPGGENKSLYADLFKNMTDKEFDLFMVALRDKKRTLAVIAPNGGNVKLSVENNFKIAKEIGHDFFQHLIIGPTLTAPVIKTPNKYLVFKLPFRRASQLLIKKISIPKNNETVDLTTGQVTGASKGSKITFPELQILVGLGLDKSLIELMKYRGGDKDGLNAMNAHIEKYGHVAQDSIAPYATGVVSGKTLKSYFRAMHLSASV